MKRRMFWVLKGNRHQRYTEQPLLVMEGWHSAVKLIYPDGTVKTDLAENYEAIDEVS